MSNNNGFRSSGCTSGDGWDVLMAPPPRRPVANAVASNYSSNQHKNNNHLYDSSSMPSALDNRSTPRNNLPRQPQPQPHQHQQHHYRIPPTSPTNRHGLQRQSDQHQQHHHSNSNSHNNNLKRRHSPLSNHHHHDPSYHQRNSSPNHHHHHHHDSNKRHRSGVDNQSSSSSYPPPPHSCSSNTMVVSHHQKAVAASLPPPPPPPPARPGMVKKEQSNLSAAASQNAAMNSNPRIKQQETNNKKKEQVLVVDLTGNDDDDSNVDKKPPAIAINNNNNHNHLVAAVNNNNEMSTHILFVLDFSSSMQKKDVKTSNQKGHRKFVSRWDAVFECIRSFLAEQLATQNNNNNRNNNSVDNNNGVIDVDKIYNNAMMMIVSVVIFNDSAETLLERMPLVHDGKKVLAALDTAQKLHKPKGGTGFSAGFERAKLLAAASKNNNTKERNSNINNNNVILVFLSDGRPGDLQPTPPLPQMPMQTTFRRNGQTYPAAGVHIEAMQRANGDDRFSLQLVCLCPEGRNWLRYLADRYNGTFHEPDLTLDNDAAPTAVPKQTVATMNNRNVASTDEDDDDDGVLDVVVKSQNTVLREKFNRAVAAGNVHTVASTTTAASQTTSSMRSTFQSISSTVTAMRNGCSSSRLPERQVVLAEKSPMISYHATRMVLDADHGRILLAPGEQPDGRLISVSMKPFAQGGLRNVYRMQQSGERPQVAKESRHDIKYSERLKFHIESAKCMAKAKLYAKAFNSHVKKKQANNNNNSGSHHHHHLAAVPPIEFLSAEVYRLKDSKYPGGFRYLAVEPEMKGKYEKWNSNNGFVNNTACTQCLVAQAFSHFSYEYSKKEELVVDIQGSGNEFTDPQLHSKVKQFGRADRGESGFRDFFHTHKCNYICLELGLKNRTVDP